MFKKSNHLFLVDVIDELRVQQLMFQERILMDDIMSQNLYFLTTGEVAMVVPAKNKPSLQKHHPEDVMIGLLGPGSDFEVPTALAGTRMISDYVAVTNSEVWWIDRQDFLSVLKVRSVCTLGACFFDGAVGNTQHTATLPICRLA